MPAKPKKQSQAATPEGSDEERQALVEEAIEKSEKLAESQLDMARLFLTRGKPDVARRRLRDVIESYGQSEAAKEARKMLRHV